MGKLRGVIISLLFALSLAGCVSEEVVVTEEVTTTKSFATEIQHNNRTVRVKNFAKVAPNTEATHASDEYVRFGFFYESYATPDELEHVELLYDETSLSWDKDIPDYLIIAYGDVNCPTYYDMFCRHAIENYLEDKNVIGVVKLFRDCAYDDMCAYSYRCGNKTYIAVITQTEEDLEKGENVYSLYVGVNSILIEE